MIQETILSYKTKKESGTPDSATLFISLYLVVLAFFLMLNSIALINEQKSKAAVKSVNGSFSGKLNAPTLQRDEQNSVPEGQDISLGEYFTMIKKYVEENIQITDTKMDLRAGTMTLTIPSRALFVPETAEIQGKAKPTLQKLVANLSPPKPGAFIELVCILRSPHFLDNVHDIYDQLDTFRAAMFARTMVDFGMPAKTLSTGVTPGADDTVVLTFHVRSADGAENTLTLE